MKVLIKIPKLKKILNLVYQIILQVYHCVDLIVKYVIYNLASTS